jgi:Ca-activated chloride channel family protein
MKRKRIWLGVFLASIIFTALITCTNTISSSALDIADDSDDDRTLAPYFFVEGANPATDSFPLKETNVTANINGVIADIYVMQTYANQGEKPINASYVFPASSRVSVHGMKMEIGDKVVTAVIKERQEAKQEFEEAKSEGKSASLLEQQRPNVFSMDLANIMPGDVVCIELHYTELIVSTEGIYQFAFPTVVGPRYSSQPASTAPQTDQWVSSPYLPDGKTPPGTYNITVNLSTGVPIADITCTSHKIDVTPDGESTAQVTLADADDFAGNRDFILDYKLAGPVMSCGLMLNAGEDENFFMLMVQPPERFEAKDIPPREYIFVLDVSGSMFGYPLDTAKKLIRDLVGGLNKTDTFNLILFSGDSYQMSPKSLSATEKNIKKAVDIINNVEGGGGTELAAALEEAIAIPQEKNISRTIVVITDGYIAEEKATFELIRENLNKASFFSFGIGTSVNRYLIDGIAKAGLGEPFIVTEPQEAAAAAKRFRTYIQSPLLTNIRVEYSGFDAYDIEPPHIAALFAQRPIVIFGKWRGEPSGSIRISGKTGGSDYDQEIQLSETEPLKTNTAISYLWARTKVERLMDYGFNQTEEYAVKKEVTAIGLKYSMMTEYTSFVAVLDDIRNTDKNSTTVEQPLPLPLYVSNWAVGGYGIGAEPGDIVFIAAILLMLFFAIGKPTARTEGRRQKNLM